MQRQQPRPAQDPFSAIQHDAAKASLTNVVTQQSLTLIEHQSSQLWKFAYRDNEVSFLFSVAARVDGMTRWRVPACRDLVVDFNAPECKQLRTSYGLWRRASYFLLESLSIWFERIAAPNGNPARWVEMRGRWVNGCWDPARYMRVTVGRAMRVDTSPIEQLIPLSTQPATWRFPYEGPAPREFKIDLEVAPNGEVPIIATARPLHEQLRQVPHFLRSDGKAALYQHFVRAYYHRSEDYIAVPYYGYVNEQCAFTFSINMERWTFHSPALASKQLQFNDHFCKVARPWAMGVREDLYLAPALHEEFLYALADIWCQIEELRHDEWPTKLQWIEEKVEVRGSPAGAAATHPERTGARFGLGLDQFFHGSSGEKIYFADTDATIRFTDEWSPQAGRPRERR